MQHDPFSRLLGQVYELLIPFSGGRIWSTWETDETSIGKSVLPGDMFVSKLLTRELTEDISNFYRGDGQIPTDPLTPREREVLKMVAEGKSNKEIADLLYISTRTVENHRAHMMSKLNLKKTADLIRYALQKGYISNLG